MPAMKPGSGGPYSEQKDLRFRVNWLKNDLANKPMSPKARKEAESELAELKVKLSAVNAKIRRKKSSATNRGKAMKTMRRHPLDATEIAEGRELEVGEILEKSDVFYSASTGRWGPIPEAFVGSPVATKESQGQFSGRTATIVRPLK